MNAPLAGAIVPEVGSSATTILERFEQAWQERPPADLEAHLPPRDDPGRVQALIDLVHIDLEYRWKAGAGLPVEDYLRRYPELNEPGVVLDLAVWEYDLRRRTEPDLEPGEFACRFPTQAGPLAARLAQLADVVRSPRRPAAPPPEVPGYEVLEELGQGGMGVVYKARQVGLDRLVALKLIRADLSLHPLARQRFETEAKAIARLDHPGIVRVHDSGMHGGQPYFVLEYVAGGNLSGLLRRGPLPPRQAADLVAHLADAVQHAHDAGIVHRDLKPANVLLAFSRGSQIRAGPARFCETRLNDAVPKIADFGLARNLSAGGQTQPGDCLGTPAYMSPEQAAGETDRGGPAVDVFGLGAILYECLTGRPPFVGTTRDEVVRQARNGQVVPPRRIDRRVPALLERICLRALARDPARRHATAAALRDDLRLYLRRRRLAPKLAAGLGLLLAMAVTVALAWPGKKEDAVRVDPVPERVRIDRITFEGTIRQRMEWVDILRRPERVLPIRNGEIIRVGVKLDHPGYVYLIYLDGEGTPVPLYPWNDVTREGEPAKLRVFDLASPPPPRSARREVRSPATANDGWPLLGKSSFDGLLVLARATPLPASVSLASLVRRQKPPDPDAPDKLIARSSPEVPELAFDFARGTPTDLRGKLDDPRGLGPDATPVRDALLGYLTPFCRHFDAVAAFRFTHEGE